MTAASAFGDAEFDDVRHQISEVQRLESAPRFWSWVLRSAVKQLALFTINAAQRVTAWACGRLERKAVQMERSVHWFRKEYDDFRIRVVRGPKLPSPEFIKQAQAARAKTAIMVRVCRKNVQKLNTLSVSDTRLMRAYENLVQIGLAMDLELQRYEETASAALRCEGALRRTHALGLDLERMAMNFNEDDPLMSDPEINAAAEAAVQRIQTRNDALPAN